MTAKEIDGVVDALSRTITELREAKQKLAKAEAVNASNLEIKRNLALRINELQKELSAAEDRLVKKDIELLTEKHRNEGLIRTFERHLDFNIPLRLPAPQLRCRAADVPAWMKCYRLDIPAFSVAHMFDADELTRTYGRMIPQIVDMLARQWGRQYGEEMTKLISTHLQEISK